MLSGIVYLHNNKNVDIALFKPDSLAFFKSNITLDVGQPVIGDEGYFLGFPFGLNMKGSGNLNNGFAFPFVKKALHSASIFENNLHILFLDGSNNPGFSGGPVFFQNRSNVKENKWFLAGVVSSYINQNNEMVTPFGNIKYIENSGIMIVYGRKHIEEIIKQM